MIAFTRSKQLADSLALHPRVSSVKQDSQVRGLRFDVDGRSRSVDVGASQSEFFGLLELMDNNPLVCADEMSIPSLGPSLALICLGPLLLSGLVKEAPVFVSNLPLDLSEIESALKTVNWSGGVAVQTEPVEVDGVAFATGMAVIDSLDDPEELADLYQERFGKSGIVRLASAEEWHPEQVAGRPCAYLRISVVPDQPHSLVSIKTMCDTTGAFETAQIINALNIMCGFEDDLGISP